MSELHPEEVWAPEPVYGNMIALCKHWPKHDSEANARLMAAAPELLAACQTVLSRCRCGDSTCDVCEPLAVAIQKAKG